MSTSQLWKDYESVAQFLVHELREKLGLQRAEGKQKVAGNSGAQWEIDAKGIAVGDSGFVIIECRRWVNQRLSQEDLGALAYRIKDTGAQGGITVSPLDLQEGAKIIAQHENVKHLQIDPSSTETQYIVRFLNEVFLGLMTEQASSASLGIIVQRAPKFEP